MRRLTVALVAMLLAAAVVVAYLRFQPTETGTVDFKGVQLTVDIAKTSAQWEQGLSGRPSMSQSHGMLFVFDHADLWQFWMHGMEFPLDIIWFDANHSVVYFVQDLPTCPASGCPTFSPPVAASYALEVNAGFISSHNVTLADTFSLTP